MQMDPGITQLLNTGGIVSFLVLVVIYGGIKKWWVFGWTYQREVERGDRWEALAMRGASVAVKQSHVAETMLEPVKERIEFKEALGKLAEEIELMRRSG